MKKFATELAQFLRRHYPQAAEDGWYRFSCDIQIVGGDVEVEIPVLTRLPDLERKASPRAARADPFKDFLPNDGDLP